MQHLRRRILMNINEASEHIWTHLNTFEHLYWTSCICYIWFTSLVFYVAPGQERHITVEDLKAFLSDYPTAHVPQRAEPSWEQFCGAAMSLRMGAVDFSVGSLSSVCSEVLSWTWISMSDYVRLSWWGINSWNSVEIGTMILSEPEMWFSRFCFPELQRPDHAGSILLHHDAISDQSIGYNLML